VVDNDSSRVSKLTNLEGKDAQCGVIERNSGLRTTLVLQHRLNTEARNAGTEMMVACLRFGGAPFSVDANRLVKPPAARNRGVPLAKSGTNVETESSSGTDRPPSPRARLKSAASRN
jgi:hypothetical protein